MEAKHTQIFTAFAFVFLVGGIVGGWYFFTGEFEKGCEQIKNEICDILEKENYCNVDNDCAIVSVLGCPFGCTNYINRRYDISILEQKYEEFYSCSGEKCVLNKCGIPGLPTCQFNKCVEGYWLKDLPCFLKKLG